MSSAHWQVVPRRCSVNTLAITGSGVAVPAVGVCTTAGCACTQVAQNEQIGGQVLLPFSSGQGSLQTVAKIIPAAI